MHTLCWFCFINCHLQFEVLLPKDPEIGEKTACTLDATALPPLRWARNRRIPDNRAILEASRDSESGRTPAGLRTTVPHRAAAVVPFRLIAGIWELHLAKG